MRLSTQELQAIKNTFQEYFLPHDKIWLFGSRVDDTKKGGDIDLYIETYYENEAVTFEKKINFITALTMKIGDQKIDCVINRLKSNYHLPIYDVARKEGVLLI